MIDQPSQKILEFCWTNNIKTLPINLRVQDGKKTYLSGEEGRFEDGRYNFKMTDFPKLTFKECKALTELYADETEWIAIDTNEIQQLDIDDPSWEFDSEAVQLLIGENERIPYFPSITKKCPHFFIRTEKRKNCWRTTKVPCDHDVLSGQWSFAKRDQEVFDHNQPIPFKELPEKEPEGRKLQTKEPSMSQNPHPVTTLHASDVASTLSKEPVRNLRGRSYQQRITFIKRLSRTSIRANITIITIGSSSSGRCDLDWVRRLAKSSQSTTRACWITLFRKRMCATTWSKPRKRRLDSATSCGSPRCRTE